MDEIARRLEIIKERIATAALRVGRDPQEIKLLAASKTVPPERIRQAALAGIRLFGENYVQEAQKKISKLKDLNLTWHLIGHLQKNKAKQAVKLFDLIETLDSLPLAHELNRRAQSLGRIIPVLVEVNIGGEETKAGLLPKKVLEFLYEVAELKNISVCGLMIIPPFRSDPEEVRPFFRRLKELAEEIKRAAIPGIEIKELSMGMSHDFEVAIEEGATIVRLGTAIFGPRPPRP
ncbi:YggS family pyridoxal phosphate-dependent enzyme [Thermosulfuriphilus sp.]